MIKSYKYLDTAIQLRLHVLIISFFDRIEFETAHFSNTFFSNDLLELANRHPRILKQPCIQIYNLLKLLSQDERSKLCREIRESNEIESICEGIYTPKKLDSKEIGLNKLLRDLFLNLYNQVLDGKPFDEKYNTNLREHFDNFSKLNADITLCPICGIGELKKHADKTRDQYDHYLPKSLYPLSSINFRNLVPICRECNSLEVKGDNDIIVLAQNKHLFYLYDRDHKGITLKFEVVRDSLVTDDITWKITYSNIDNKNDQINSWKKIYDIDDRYQGFVNARIKKWFTHYWNFVNDSEMSEFSLEQKNMTYYKFLKIEEEQYLSYIKMPALSGFLASSIMNNAVLQSKKYSLPPTT